LQLEVFFTNKTTPRYLKELSKREFDKRYFETKKQFSKMNQRKETEIFIDLVSKKSKLERFVVIFSDSNLENYLNGMNSKK
jgi:hypothetical protein